MTKYWTLLQNNSGGVFDHDPEKGVGYAICVEAVDERDAKARIDNIIDNYDQGVYCACCGERWPYRLDEKGADFPSIYGEPLTGEWGIPSYVHLRNGKFYAISDTKRVKND